MSDIDNLEEISELMRYSFNDMKRGVSKASRMRFKMAHQRAASAQRSVAKQQFRSSDRRGVLARIENQD